MHSRIDQRNLLTARDLSRTTIMKLFDRARDYQERLQRGERIERLDGKLVATLFFQPSTRTRLSFETAVSRLGGGVIGFADAEVSRAGSGWRESLADTAQVLNGYVDAVVIRHPEVGAAKAYAALSSIPVINGGDGDGAHSEHPTQSLLDLYSFHQQLGRIDGMKLLVLGHLTQRCSHSLLLSLAKFDNVEVLLFSEHGALLDRQEEEELRSLGLELRYVNSLEEAVPIVDAIYVTGMKEDPDYPVPEPFIVTAEKLKAAKPHLRVYHPLPRGKELPYSLDRSDRAAYFDQAANGVPVRMAVLDYLIDAPRG